MTEVLANAVFVTGNRNKAREARRILGLELAHREIDLPEIQSGDIEEVAEAKAREAFERVRGPIIIEETGLELVAMNGFPGPLVKWLLAAVGPEGIARTAQAMGEARATAVCHLIYCDREHSISATGRTSGQLILPARGTAGFGWDPVFQPDGDDGTYAELGDRRKDEIGHRGRAWRALVLEFEKEPERWR